MASSQPPPVHTGRIIGGRYVVEEALGRGGMAQVYRVRDNRTGTKLALKRSWARTTRKEQRRRVFLEREFQTLAHLSHPCIISVHDYGVDEDGPYYTMELLDGADLDKTGQLPWREACALLRDVASSLAILHSRGLLHRDVSARNVRRTSNGRAKLIDFGAMASIGVPSEVVGTAPFVAPEVLQMQALDARADLFSLGALAYYLITGRHAYAARKLSELRDAWRTRPAAPARLLPEVPSALSQLILQLLSLDRGARPQNAAEVMERLCAIAELSREELGDVSHAYLAMPTLIGREKALVAIRTRMLSLVRGDGGALLIDGVAGSGRSRLLDACVLEGKLLGAQVARADASEGAQDWAVARALCSQLITLFPKPAVEAARLSRDVLGHVLDEVRGEAVTVSSLAPERSLILRELRDFVLALSQGQRALLVVDDADQIDEPSAALLAAIADKLSRHGMFLVLSVERGAVLEASPSLQLLAALSDRIEIEPLNAEQTDALVRAVFGDAQNAQLCAGRIHALAQGNPQVTLELAQHLVDRNLARYEAGSWRLPGYVADSELPKTLSESLQRRIDQLGRDARELAEALCLADAHTFPVLSYRALTTHRDQKRVFAALQELVAARVLIAAEHHHFSQRGFVTVLTDGMPKLRRQTLHSRIADLLARTGGEPLARVNHLLSAGREIEGIELLCSLDLSTKLPSLGLLERAVAYAESEPSLPKRVLHRLRMALLMKAPLVSAIGTFRRALPPVLSQLEHDTGLTRYRELSDVPKAERLMQAIGYAQQRFIGMSERERVYAPSDAIRELARLSGAASGMAVSFFDLALIESLPSLEPLMPLSPALQVISQLVEAGRAWICGRGVRSQVLYKGVLDRIAQADRAGFDDQQYDRIRHGVHYALALVESALAISAAEERAKLLEQHRSMRVAAWRVRMLLHFNQGNVEAARTCMRRSELLQLQDGSEWHYLGLTAGFELMSAATAGDLLGVKTALDAMEPLADEHPGWKPMQIFGRSRFRELQGDLPGALDIALAGLELAQPGRHLVFPILAASRVRLLHGLGRLDEAVAIGTEYLELCAREDLTPLDRQIMRELAPALAQIGEYTRAVELIESALVWAERVGCEGLPLGVLYEARAKVALAMDDHVAFAHASERCAIEFRKSNSPVLSARLAALLDDARRRQLPALEATRELTVQLEEQRLETEYGVVRGRLFECVDRADRARCSLTILLQSAESFEGYLYGVDDAELIALAGLPTVEAETGFSSWLSTWFEAEQAAERESAASIDEEESATGGGGSVTGTEESQTFAPRHAVPSRFVDVEGRHFEAMLLIGRHHERRTIAGALALRLTGRAQPRPPSGLLSQIASHLLDQGDLSGVALEG